MEHSAAPDRRNDYIVHTENTGSNSSSSNATPDEKKTSSSSRRSRLSYRFLLVIAIVVLVACAVSAGVYFLARTEFHHILEEELADGLNAGHSSQQLPVEKGGRTVTPEPTRVQTTPKSTLKPCPAWSAVWSHVSSPCQISLTAALHSHHNTCSHYANFLKCAQFVLKVSGHWCSEQDLQRMAYTHGRVLTKADHGLPTHTSRDYGYHRSRWGGSSDYYGSDASYRDDSSDYYGADSSWDGSSDYYGSDASYRDDSSDYYGADSSYWDGSSDYYGDGGSLDGSSDYYGSGGSYLDSSSDYYGSGGSSWDGSSDYYGSGSSYWDGSPDYYGSGGSQRNDSSDYYGSGGSSWDGSSDYYGSGGSSWDGSSDYYGSGGSQWNDSSDYYGSGSSWDGSSDYYGSGGSSLDGLSDYYGSGSSYWGGSSDYYGSGSSYWDGSSDYYGSGGSQWNDSSDYYGSGSSYWDGSSDYYGSGGSQWNDSSDYYGSGSSSWDGSSDYYGSDSSYPDSSSDYYGSGGSYWDGSNDYYGSSQSWDNSWSSSGDSDYGDGATGGLYPSYTDTMYSGSSDYYPPSVGVGRPVNHQSAAYSDRYARKSLPAMCKNYMAPSLVDMQSTDPCANPDAYLYLLQYQCNDMRRNASADACLALADKAQCILEHLNSALQCQESTVHQTIRKHKHALLTTEVHACLESIQHLQMDDCFRAILGDKLSCLRKLYGDASHSSSKACRSSSMLKSVIKCTVKKHPDRCSRTKVAQVLKQWLSAATIDKNMMAPLDPALARKLLYCE